MVAINFFYHRSVVIPNSHHEFIQVGSETWLFFIVGTEISKYFFPFCETVKLLSELKETKIHSLFKLLSKKKPLTAV